MTDRPSVALPFPGQPLCATDPGSWCAKVYRLSHTDWLARSADDVVHHGISIALVVLVAVVLRLLAHRAVNRLIRITVSGQVPGVLQPLRDRAAATLRTAAPSIVERRAQRAATIGSVLRSGATFVIYSVGFVMVLGEFGINLAPIIASAGIVGVALGFGAQNLVKDFLSGIFMTLEDQYGVGDIVDLGQASGTVETVGLRVTTIRDASGTVWHVRNGEVLRVGNSSQGFSVAVVDLPLARAADVDTAAAVAGDAAREVTAETRFGPDVLEPPEVLGVQSVTADAVTLRLSVKTRPGKHWAVQRALNGRVKAALDAAGIPAPSPAERPVGSVPPPGPPR